MRGPPFPLLSRIVFSPVLGRSDSRPTTLFSLNHNIKPEPSRREHLIAAVSVSGGSDGSRFKLFYGRRETKFQKKIAAAESRNLYQHDD
jgi:hypothetical protein